MEKTNFTFVRPLSWIKALGLVLVAITMAGLQTANAQCPAPAGVSATTTGQGSATLVWDSGSDAVDHCFNLEVGGIAFTCGADESIVELVLCEGVTPGLMRTGNTFTYEVTGLQPGTTYDWSLNETCDGAAPPNNVSGPCVKTGITFMTYDDQYVVTPSNIVAPSCPLVSPGFTPDGSFDITVTDGTTCAGTYDITVAGPYVLIGSPVVAQPAGTFSFSQAGPGSYTVTVTEVGPCNPPTDPVVINVVVPDGTDNVDPIFYVTDILGNIIVDNDAFTAQGTSVNVGSLDIPEGSCSLQAQYYAFGFDQCDGFIIAPGAVVSSSVTTPASVDPATQVSDSDDGLGNYLIDVNWSVGTTVLSISGFDASGNSADLSITATVEDNVDPVVSALGGFNFTVPACDDDVTVTVTIQVDDLCDQDVSLANLTLVDFDGAPAVLNFTGSNYFEYFVTVDEGDDADLWAFEYTDDFGNTGLFNVVINVTKASEDQAPILIADNENISVAACEDDVFVAYSFHVIDDCQTPSIANVTFDDDGSGLTLGFNFVSNNTLFVEATGTVAPGDYFPVITYDDGDQAVATGFPGLSVTQDPDQPADITLPGNLTFTLPNCTDEAEVTFAIQIADDCDAPAAGTFTLGGDPITPTFTDGDGYFEFTETISADNNGDLLFATYTDGAGNISAEDALITVLSTPDTWAPIIVYPAQDINLELDPCDAGGVASAFFEITATDNCDGATGWEATITAFGGTIAGAAVFPSPGGESILVLAEAGLYQVIITAEDNSGNVRQEDFFINVTQDPAPQTNLGCNDNINVTLNDDCQALIVPDMILEGNPGCLTDADFDIVVVDGNIANGAIADGCGEYNVHIEIAGGSDVSGFNGPYAPATWAVPFNIAGTNITFTNTTLTLESFDAGDFDGGDFDEDGIDVAVAHAMLGDGTLSLDYDFNGVDAGWDWFVIDVDGDVLASDEFAASGTVSTPVVAGEILLIGIDDDGAAPIGTDENSTLTITNFSAPAGSGSGFTECWGTISAEDKTDPVIVCPDDTDQATLIRDVQEFSGALATTDASLDPTDHPCLLDAFQPPAGVHYYDLYTFTVTQSDVYTFDIASSWGDASAALFQGGFNPDEVCSNIIAQSDDAFQGTGFYQAFDPIIRITLPLIAGETYTLYTSSFAANIIGDYSWAVYSDGNGLIDDSPAPGISPVPTVSPIVFDIICDDIDNILITSPETYVVDRDGNTIPGTMSSFLRTRLDYTGRPDISDNCGDVLVTVVDTYAETGDCSETIVTRTFSIADKYNSDCTGAPNTAVCTQEITVRKPTVQDVIFPSFTAFVECDEGFATDANGNVDPSISGYPFLFTAFGIQDLNDTYCNLGASYTDNTRIETCAAGYKLIRAWDVLDWCNPGSSLLFNQIIKVGDFTAPTVECPFPDWDQNGIPDAGYLTYSTGPFDCTAAFSVPLPTVTDNCSSWEVHTDIATTIEQDVVNEYGQVVGTELVDIVVASIPANAPSRYVGGIPLGCHRFVYTVTDECGNETVVECPFLVEDQVEPTAVCDDDLNISIGGSGVSRVYAEDIDEGSNDNCGPIRIEVRRLVSEDAFCNPIPPFFTPWGDYVDINCCDVEDMVRIELRVWDDRNGDGIPGNSIYVERCDGTLEYITDNSNVCWLDVLVEDKANPFCIAPHDVTVSCEDLPYGFDASNIDQLADLFNVPVGPEAQDNCFATPDELPPFVNLDDCGFGTILRRFRAVDASGNVSTNSCQQLITVLETHNYEIKFPRDASANCGDPNPDTVTYNELACDLLAVSSTDEFFSASGDECYKIFRTWRVINWCEYDGEADPVVVSRDEDCDGNPGDEDIWVLRRPNIVFFDRDNNENNNNPLAFTKGTACDGLTNPTGYWINSNMDSGISSVGFWEYTQHIRVYDDIDPVITAPTPDPFCSIDNVDCDGPVSHPFSVDENCTPDDITVKVFLDAFADGIIDDDLTATALSGSYPDYSIDGEFPIGSHAFEVHVEDGCGNSALLLLPFQVVDCKAPTPICINGLAIELMPVEPGTDADGDGDVDTGAMGIWASDFIASPVTDCSEPIKYSMNRVGETPDMDATGIVLTCDDPSTLIVEIYAWDSAYNPYAVQPDGTVGGPNYDFCETYVLVQDNMFNLCDGGGALVSGTIATEEDALVEGVEVGLSGQTNATMTTTDDGTYQFVNLELFYDYTVTPSLDLNYLNGVSTFDLVLISKHILGVTPLGSPYRMIAADVNKSASITTLDLIQLRKLILTIDTEFNNNTSWRFVDAAFDFPDANNPWLTDFPEVINLNNLNSDMLSQDFVAVKIGDVNGSASVSAFASTPDERTNGTFAFELDEQAIKAGNEYTVDFTAADIASIQGYQATLTFDATALELVDMIYGAATEDNFGMRFVEEGMITTSWNGEAAANEVLFSLVFRANADANLSELMGISSRYTAAEAYNLDDETLDVAINFNTGAVATAGFELYQNTPNPFKAETLIGFNIPEAAEVTIRIHDVTGKALKMIRGDFAKGYNNVTVNAKELPTTGVLYYTIETADYTATKKMIIVE